MLFIGITGGVGAGKSEILKYLADGFSCRVMLADNIAHDVMEPGTDCNARLQELFAGDGVFCEDGQVDRLKMAQVLFTNKEKLEALNAIVHPAVKQYVIEQAKAENEKGELDFLVLEAALLIEEHYDEICDELWYIYTSEENRRMRLKSSRGYSDEKIDNILRSQLSEAEFRTHCKVEIDNNGSLEQVYAQLDAALEARGIRK